MAILIASERAPSDQYAGRLEKQIAEINPHLLSEDAWDRDFIQEIFKIPDNYLALMRMKTSGNFRSAAIDFTSLPSLVSLEMKAFMSAHLSDERSWGKDWLYRRRYVIQWLAEGWSDLYKEFGVDCIADIPHPMTTSAKGCWCDNSHANSSELMAAYSRWYESYYSRKATQQQKFISGGKLITKTYVSGDIAVVGSIQTWLIVNRERITKPITQRNVILLNDLFSETDTRFEDRQRTRDHWIQFFRYPEWMRPVVREYLLDKIAGLSH